MTAYEKLSVAVAVVLAAALPSMARPAERPPGRDLLRALASDDHSDPILDHLDPGLAVGLSDLDMRILAAVDRNQLADYLDGVDPAQIHLAGGGTLAELILRSREASARGLLFSPIEPCRVMDSRSSLAGRLEPGVPVPIWVRGGIDLSSQGGPAEGCPLPEFSGAAATHNPVRAVAVNVRAIAPDGNGSLTLWPSDRPQPKAGDLSFDRGRDPADLGHGVIVPVCSEAGTEPCRDGDVLMVSRLASVDVVLEVVGYFHEAGRAGSRGLETEAASPEQALAHAPETARVRREAAQPGGPGARAAEPSRFEGESPTSVTTGFAVRGEGGTNAVGLYGFSEDNYAVYGFDGGTTQARGYGGYFYSENGVGAYGRSNAESTAQNQWAPGLYGRSTSGVGVYGLTGSNLSYMAAVRGENLGFGYGGYFSSENGIPLFVIRNTGVGNLMEAWTLNPVNRVFRINTAGNVYADGTYSSPADFAEVVRAAQTDLVPGEVLSIAADGRIRRSSGAFETTVSGVYSTKPGFVGDERIHEREEYEADEILMAILGIVPTKVTTENGPIAAGDLLVTASLPGHAMRAGENPPAGTVFGKALEPHAAGSGVIRVLVTLQ